MNANLFGLLAAIATPVEALRRLTLGLVGDNVEVDFDTSWFERNINLLYPVLGLGTLALVGWAVWTMARTQELTTQAKGAFKLEIMTMLRRFPVGASAEKIGEAIKLPTMKTAQLLEEMREDGQVLRDETRQPVIFRLKLSD